MGQYSLENYEKYKTHKIRPALSHLYPDNWGCKKYTPVGVSWKEAELKPGHFDFSSVQERLLKASNPLLHIDFTAPVWAVEPLDDLYRSFVMKLGSEFDQGWLVGVFLHSSQCPAVVMEAFQAAFQETPVILGLEDQAAQDHFRKTGFRFGLRISCGTEDVLACRELFARRNLQHIWKTAPVIVQMKAGSSKESLEVEAKRWHAAFANEEIDVGFRIELRKLAYPKEISSGGALPLRFWFVNTGTAPCYAKITLKVRLFRADAVYDIPLNTQDLLWKPGDIVHNEIVRVPAAEPGEYGVSLGLFIGGHVLQLANDLSAAQDFYELGKVVLDERNRDELFGIWEHYYPEGYYPLEDPQAPNEPEREGDAG